VNQDLVATRAHAPDEGTMLKGEVIDGFVEVGKCMSDIIKFCIARCSSRINRQLSPMRAGQIREYLRGKPNMQDSDKLVELADGCNLQLVTQILIWRYLSLALEQFVFQPFLPGEAQGDKAAQVFFDILDTAQHHESQDRSGRWRALTYKHALSLSPRDEGWCVEPATSLVNDISGLVTVVNESKLTNEELEAAFQLIWRMFNTAAQFKDKAMMICTDVDFMVHLRRGGERFNPGYMREACKGGGSSKRVVLGAGLGLQLARNLQKESTVERGYEHPIPAQVIGDENGLFSSGW
jgi:hypothetical protein